MTRQHSSELAASSWIDATMCAPPSTNAQLSHSTTQLLAQAQAKAKCHTFLGESYTIVNGVGYVQNSDKNVAKLAQAYERLQESTNPSSGVIATKRNVASLISLVMWMAHTVQLPRWQLRDNSSVFAYRHWLGRVRPQWGQDLHRTTRLARV
eukprot:PhM_4_TR13888/c2_g1_i2/m.56526